MTMSSVSLVHGWLPVTVQTITATALIGSLARRPRHWYAVWLAPIAAVGVIGAAAARAVLSNLGVAGDEPAPWQLWAWVALSATAIATVFTGWPQSHWYLRNLTVFAASFGLLSTGLVVNGWIGYLPTVGIAWNQFTNGPLPGQTDWASVTAMRQRGIRPATGALVTVAITPASSTFAHRDELVYLPPIWFTQGPASSPLPAVMMIAGEFHTPADWVRIGEAVTTLDDFASEHDGSAPVAVFVDSGGAFGNDTECVNGPRGNAADHLVKDVVPYVVSTFDVSASQANWGVAGFSSGGTCALDLTVMHPDRFGAFVDIAGDRGPNTGTKEQTIARLYGGDEEAWQSFDPSTVIARHGPYENVSGLFISPGGAPVPGVDETLCALGRSRSIACHVWRLPGRHDWPFATNAFEASLPWLAEQLGSPPSGTPSRR